MVSHLSTRAVPSPTPARGLGRLGTPYVLLVVVALVLGALVWGFALSGNDAATQAVSCPVTPESDEAGFDELEAQALDSTEPALLADTRVRVLNANGESGQAGAVAAQLAERGFRAAGADATGNDPIYAQNLDCHGQIRFGDTGRATARALSVAAPCMQLVSDGRDDATVDLVLGTIFGRLTDSTAAVTVLDELKVGRQPAPSDLQSARAVNC